LTYIKKWLHLLAQPFIVLNALLDDDLLKDYFLAISATDGSEELGKLWKQRFVESARSFQ